MAVRATVRRLVPFARSNAGRDHRRLQTALAIATVVAAVVAPSGALAANRSGDGDAADPASPSVIYQESVAHAGDRIAFTAGRETGGAPSIVQRSDARGLNGTVTRSPAVNAIRSPAWATDSW